MGLGAVLLMFWPLIIYGYAEGEFTGTETVTQGVAWLVLLVSVSISHASWMYFAIPATGMTIFAIIRVVGWDAWTLRTP